MSQGLKKGRPISVATVMKSAPFKAGVADQRADKWREWAGDQWLWRGRVAAQAYELGRLVSLFAGDQPVRAEHYHAVVDQGWFVKGRQ